MKKQLATIESVKQKLECIKNEEIQIAVNRGRKRFVKFNAKLVSLYPSVFTVVVENSVPKERSYSYTEVLCGNVRVYPKNT